MAVGAPPFLLPSALGNLPLKARSCWRSYCLVYRHKTFKFQWKVCLPNPGIPAMTGTPALEQGTAVMARALLGAASSQTVTTETPPAWRAGASTHRSPAGQVGGSW